MTPRLAELLTELAQVVAEQPAPAAPPEPLIRLREAAALSGWSYRHLLDAAKAGRIRAYLPPGHTAGYRVRWSEFLEDTRVTPSAPAEGGDQVGGEGGRGGPEVRDPPVDGGREEAEPPPRLRVAGGGRGRSPGAGGGAAAGDLAARFLPALDGLRGVAIVLVVLHHATDGAFQPGWLGVDLFFALSGYLITERLLATVDRPDYWSRFVSRRARRILPLYATVLAAVALVRWAGLDHAPASPWWTYAAFVANYWVAAYGFATPLLSVTWSLCIEEQFYVAWPWVVRAARGRLPAVCLAVLALSPLLRLALVAWLGDAAIGPVYVLTPTRLDGLAAGALVACGWWTPGRLTAALWAATAGFGVATWWAGVDAGLATLGYSAVAVAGAWAVWLAVHRGPAVLSGSVLGWLGRVSFGLYLLHVPAILACGPVLGVLVAMAVAGASWRWFEEPILRGGR